jgi:hypothetical protein
VLGLHEPRDARRDAVVGAAAAGVAAVAVGLRGPAVDAHPDAHAVLVEQRQERVVDQDAVGLHREPGGRKGVADHAQGGCQKFMPGEERFSAVQHDAQLAHFMIASMLVNTLRDPFERLHGHRRRPGPPALVDAFVYVTVIAAQIASTVNLEDHLAHRRAHGHQSWIWRIGLSSGSK